ncbi:glycopeptide antibiotics resistance protein [Lachnospiraceae bacterium PM6-15]|uniref:VanZ family protein n=1 Tax=Ohessyouella blattaphilus TaxID=2949333 RepID=UPI003E24A4F8
MSLFYRYSVLVVPALIIFFISLSRKKPRYPVAKFVKLALFVIYISLVVAVTGVGTIYDFGKFGEIIRLEEVQLIPFTSIGYLTYTLNIFMFVPLGFLLPFIWRNMDFLKVLLTGFSFSLFIELSQLLNRRVTDIDDLIANTLGCIIGYCIYTLFYKLFRRKGPVMYREKWGIKGEAPLLLFAMLLCNFFLFNWRAAILIS